MLKVDKFSTVPIYEQIVEALQKEIVLRLLRENEQIPSVREMSGRLGINPNTIQKSYLELARRGVIASSKGNGYFVTPQAIEIIQQQAENRLSELEDTVFNMACSNVDRELVINAVNSAYLKADTFLRQSAEDPDKINK